MVIWPSLIDLLFCVWLVTRTSRRRVTVWPACVLPRVIAMVWLLAVTVVGLIANAFVTFAGDVTKPTVPWPVVEKLWLVPA